MPRALVLGATGHIGAHVVRALLAEGHKVRAAYRSERYLRVLEGLPVERVQLDLEVPDLLPRAAEGCNWVFHAAGYYPPARERRNRAIERGQQLTRRILEEIARVGPERVVFTSSAGTIRSVPDRPANESDPEPWPLTTWRNLYSTVKIAMEQVALEACRAGLPIVVVNPSVCIGEYDAHAFSGRALLAFAKYQVPWTVETAFNVVYTGDVGMGQVRAAERGRVGERYLLTGENVRLKEFADLVCQEAGTRPPRWRLSHRWAYALACGVELAAWLARRDPPFTRDEVRRVRRGYTLEGTKARTELGLTQTPLREAVRRAIVWFRKEGML